MSAACDICTDADEHGSWPQSAPAPTQCRCPGCHRSWRMSLKQAHSPTCCAHFSAPSSFDTHLKPHDVGRCRVPAECVKPDGRPKLIHHDHADRHSTGDPEAEDRLGHDGYCAPGRVR
jgi:hypothetical protein